MNDYIPLIILIVIGIFIIFYSSQRAQKEAEKERERRATMTPEQIKAEERNKKGIPLNVSCPFCKGNNLDTTNPISGLGWALIIIGLFFTPIFGLGLILIIIGICVRDKKFYCNDCKRSF